MTDSNQQSVRLAQAQEMVRLIRSYDEFDAYEAANVIEGLIEQYAALERRFAEALDAPDLLRHIEQLEEQLESLRRVAENVRDGWLVEHVDAAQIDQALHDLDAWLQASSPAKRPT